MTTTTDPIRDQAREIAERLYKGEYTMLRLEQEIEAFAAAKRPASTEDDLQAAILVIRTSIGDEHLSDVLIASIANYVASQRQTERSRIRQAMCRLPWRIVEGESNDSWRGVAIDDVLQATGKGE